MVKRPGGELATRPLHFIWLCDCSGSMSVDGKIQALNMAIREAIPHMQKVADENPNAEVLIRALRFSNGAQWHISQPVSVEHFSWNDLSADGVTDLGKALSMLAEQIKQLPERGLPPVLVLISDGQPTDNFEGGLKDLLEQPWGRKAVRVAIAIGEDADLNILQRFINNSEIPPLKANNPEMLVKYIKWVSTAVLKSASSPASQSAEAPKPITSNVPIPLPPDPGIQAGAVDDVW
jgi:uncharacterized protein YegL